MKFFLNNKLVLVWQLLKVLTFICLMISCKYTSQNKSLIPKEWVGKVLTVQGLIPADSIGITLPHEHLIISIFRSSSDLTDESTAISELKYFSDLGGSTITEVTSIGLGRNPDALRRISSATNINIVMGSGFYKEWWLSDSIKRLSVRELSNIIKDDILYGINGIHAGIIGEIGVSKPISRFGFIRHLSSMDRKLLKASVEAQKSTGASIIVHFDIDVDGEERNYALDFMEKNGADLSRVVVSHNSPYLDKMDDFISYAKKGCYVAFDNLGLEVDDEHHMRYYSKGKLEPTKTIKALIDKGFINNILISQDVYIKAFLVENGGYGYSHILRHLIPQFREAGLSEDQINTIIIENPKRMLAF